MGKTPWEQTRSHRRESRAKSASRSKDIIERVACQNFSAGQAARILSINGPINSELVFRESAWRSKNQGRMVQRGSLASSFQEPYRHADAFRQQYVQPRDDRHRREACRIQPNALLGGSSLTVGSGALSLFGPAAAAAVPAILSPRLPTHHLIWFASFVGRRGCRDVGRLPRGNPGPEFVDFRASPGLPCRLKLVTNPVGPQAARHAGRRSIIVWLWFHNDLINQSWAPLQLQGFHAPCPRPRPSLCRHHCPRRSAARPR
jgi:hypothetical protein